MARDDLAPRAPCETAAVLAVERVEPCDEIVRGGRRAERGGDLPRDLGEADRVEPDVWVETLPLRRETPDVDAGEHVERRPAPAVDGLLHRGLKAVSGVDGERRVPHAPDVAGGQLEVVRLGTRRGEVHDLGVRAGDLAGGIGEGVEGRHDCVVARGGTAAGRRRSDREGDAQENDSRKHRCRGYQTMRIGIV